MDLRAQSQDLNSFQTDGKVNVLVATSVLEEEIDVSACNLVICFDLPKNLVQFVQRRGRARQKHSKYIMLMCEDDPNDIDKWNQLEQRTKKRYSDEAREPASYVDEGDEPGKTYEVASTGAVLYFDRRLICNIFVLSARKPASTSTRGRSS